MKSTGSSRSGRRGWWSFQLLFNWRLSAITGRFCILQLPGLIVRSASRPARKIFHARANGRHEKFTHTKFKFLNGRFAAVAKSEYQKKERSGATATGNTEKE